MWVSLCFYAVFSFCLSEEPYSNQKPFLSIWPKFTHNQDLQCAKHRTRMQGQQEESHWVFVHLSIQSYWFPASHFPPGFSTSPEPFFSPCDTDHTEQPCSAVCRKLEVTQQNSGRKQGKRLSSKRQLSRHWDDFYFLVSVHTCVSKSALWVFDPHWQVFMKKKKKKRKENINSIVHKFYFSNSQSWSWGPAHVPGSQWCLTSGSGVVICLQNQ